MNWLAQKVYEEVQLSLRKCWHCGAAIDHMPHKQKVCENPECDRAYRRFKGRRQYAKARRLKRDISHRLRFEVLERDGFKCRYCGASPKDGAVLHVDHIRPVADGGLTVADNLAVACSACNLGKSSRPLSRNAEAIIRG